MRPRGFLAGVLLFALLLGLVVPARAGIVATKHNLSASGPGQVKGVSEQEVCVFCHTPHNANPAVPLWNHQQTNAAHTMYSSDYLTDKGYAMPASVNQRSKLCLSCHDGTVALGAVYNVRGQPATIAMQKSGAPITTMPLDVAGYLGTNLTNDHPVSIGYDTGVSEIELVTPAPPLFPAKGAVKLYPPSGGTVAGTVECTSCHDPHTDTFPKFLVASNLNAGLCRTCHQKTNFDGSIHAVSSVPFTTIYGGTTVAQAACVACHKSHSGAGVPYILERQEEQTCYNGTSTSCHGSSITTYQGGVTGRNIQSTFEGKAVRHPVETSGKHRNIDTPGTLGLGSRHAECWDCHNPHQAQPGLHTLGSSLAGNALKGARGVSPNYGGSPGAPASFTPVFPVTFEYEVCLKCHSNYTTGYVTGNDGGNLAALLNPNNPSYHPVEGVGKNLGIQASAFAPGTPWASTGYNGVTSPNITCTDCHGNDTAGPNDPAGPHGSNIPRLLKKQFAASTYWSASASAELALCFSCHNYDVYYNGAAGSRFQCGMGGMGVGSSAGHQNHVKNRKISCYDCHAVHGRTDNKHLIRFKDSSGGEITAYTETPTGGSCTSNCHFGIGGGTRTYTLAYPR